jgi:hypothetical protein
MAIPAHLVIPIEGLPFDSLLADWRWLIGGNYTPILMTAFGDLFLRDDAGHIHFLDLMAGQFKQVANQTRSSILSVRTESGAEHGFSASSLRRFGKPLANLLRANVMAAKFHSRSAAN